MDLRYIDVAIAGLKSKFITHTPICLAHSVTFACNCRCKMCTQWKMTDKVSKDMKTEEVFDLLRKAYDAGMRVYYAWGGEPLIRKDLPQILEYAKKMGFVTIVNTNGALLKYKAKEIGPVTDAIVISLDSTDELHDVIRGRKGAYKEVIAGLEEIKKFGCIITIASTISKLNYDKIEDLAKFAKKNKVVITYNTVEPTLSSSYEDERTYEPVNQYGLNKEELHEFYSKLLELKNKGYPLAETKAVLRDYVDGEPFNCHFPEIFVYVSPDGVLIPCTNLYDLKPQSLKDISFQKYFASKAFKKFTKDISDCRVCLRTCVRSYAYSYMMNPEHMIELVIDLLLYWKLLTNNALHKFVKRFNKK